MSTPIKFGTDGWRAIIADTFTNTNVARVATATASWLCQNAEKPAAARRPPPDALRARGGAGK
ncbi:MAG TPA: hypothetical protein PKH93_14420, partial [Chitinophagales bacterium]|nr:hypothetical protein [Chitinophagales bacterium]